MNKSFRTTNHESRTTGERRPEEGEAGGGRAKDKDMKDRLETGEIRKKRIKETTLEKESKRAGDKE